MSWFVTKFHSDSTTIYFFVRLVMAISFLQSASNLESVVTSVILLSIITQGKNSG